jgi:hypothetical protein
MTRKRLLGGLALMAVLAVSAVAIASGGGGEPRIDQVEATITFTQAQVGIRACEGPAGAYDENRVHVVGTAEGDPRLSGNVAVSIRVFNEVGTGESTQQGRLLIRDPDTGRKKVVARFTDAGVTEIFQGTVVGSLRPTGGRLVANWRTTFHENGAITAQIGGEAADTRLPAVVARGGCTGPFTTFEIDIPPPEAAATARRASSARLGWAQR